MQSRIYRAGWKLLDVLFPPTCAGCGKWGERFCEECSQKIRLIKHPICQICGDPLLNGNQVVCERCNSSAVAYSSARSWAYFEDSLQATIHKLKYKRDIGLGSVLAKPLIFLLEKYRWQVDMIIPVPLDSDRKKERGYNQSALLAFPISWETGVPCKPELLSRVRSTKQQVGLSRSEREDNVMGAFEAKREAIFDKSVLVVDDVMTTGSTLNAYAQALMRAGAKSVYGLTLARSSYL